MLLQEELEQRTVSVSIQAAKLSGRVLRAAIAAVLQKMEQERTMPKVGRNSMKRLTYKDPGANTIEVSGRIRSFERYARKHQVRYHIEKELGTDPPKWTVYFKANQADALTAAFKEYTKKDLTRSTRPSLLTQLHKFKELAQSRGRDRVKNKEHGGPERCRCCAPCRGRCVLRPRWEATLPKPLVRSAQSSDTRFAFVRLHRACYPLTERRCSP